MRPGPCSMTHGPDAGNSGGVAAGGPSSGAGSPCERCGGETIEGALALPMLGRARFSYRLGSQSIETEVDARMCASCGALSFTASDPAKIVRAAAAVARLARRA